MKIKSIALIYNPAGGSANIEVVMQLKNALSGHRVELLATSPEPDSAFNLTRAALLRDNDLVVAVGGDGTACQVASALIYEEGKLCSIPMAVFPAGTGNLFARSFFPRPTAADFAALILHGEPQCIDMVAVEYTDLNRVQHKQYCLVGMGLGKVSDAISGASPVHKRIFGKLVYVARVSLACVLPGAGQFELQSLDGQIVTNAAAVFALNVTPPSLGMIARGCNASDGLLDVALFEGANFRQMGNIASCLAFGRPERSPHYRTLRTSELIIKSQKTMLPNIDGDPGCETREVKLRVVPQAVRMVLSKGAA